MSVALRDDLCDFLKILDAEIVHLPRKNVPNLAHQALDHILDVRDVLGAVDQDADDVDFGVARDFALDGFQRHDASSSISWPNVFTPFGSRTPIIRR